MGVIKLREAFRGRGWPLGPRQMLRLAGALLFVWGPEGLQVSGPEGPLAPEDLRTLAAVLGPHLREFKGKTTCAELEVHLDRPVRGGLWFHCSAMRREDGRLAGLLRDVTAQQTERQRLLEQAHRDWLTGLWNRQGMALRVADTITEEGKAALLMVDMDDFKAVNDSRGHLEGDRVLSFTAGLLQELFPLPAHVGRAGGDEFLVLLPGAGAIEAGRAGKSLCRALRERSPAKGLGRVSCSVGVALAPEEGEDFERLFRAADRAMYRAKERGKDMCSR